MPKKAITIRIEAALLALVRQRAASENRTLTNYIETVLKQAAAPPAGIRVEPVQVAPPAMLATVAPDPAAVAAVPILLAGGDGTEGEAPAATGDA